MALSFFRNVQKKAWDQSYTMKNPFSITQLKSTSNLHFSLHKEMLPKADELVYVKHASCKFDQLLTNSKVLTPSDPCSWKSATNHHQNSFIYLPVFCRCMLTKRCSIGGTRWRELKMKASPMFCPITCSSRSAQSCPGRCKESWPAVTRCPHLSNRT